MRFQVTRRYLVDVPEKGTPDRKGIDEWMQEQEMEETTDEGLAIILVEVHDVGEFEGLTHDIDIEVKKEGT